MKVIIQHIAASEFLATDGRWVTDKTQAQDFFSLLRAYHFAQANTSVPFRVVLHCPEDDYSANIIEGVGKAGEMNLFDDDSTCTPSRFAAEDVDAILAQGVDVSRLHLN